MLKRKGKKLPEMLYFQYICMDLKKGCGTGKANQL